MNSEIDYEAVRTRISTLMGSEKPYPWARRMGLSDATFNRFWSKKEVPKIETLHRVATGTGVSLDWLIYGRTTSQNPAAATTDDDALPSFMQSMTMTSETDGALLGRLAEAIERLYEEEHARLGTRALVELTTRHYNRIAAFTGNPEARLAMIAAVVDELRGELRKPPTADTANKRRA